MGTDELDEVINKLTARNKELQEAEAKALAEEKRKQHPLKEAGSEYNSRFAEVRGAIDGISTKLEKGRITAPVSENDTYLESEKIGFPLKRCHMQVFTVGSGPTGEDIAFDPVLNASRPGFDLEISCRDKRRVIDLSGEGFAEEIQSVISEFLGGILKDISR